MKLAYAAPKATAHGSVATLTMGSTRATTHEIKSPNLDTTV